MSGYKMNRSILILFVLSFLALVIAACQPVAITTTPVPSPIPTTSPTPTPQATPARTADDLFSSWASAAEATTEDTSLNALAQAAAGQPDTPVCGSFGTAWKPGPDAYPAQLTLYYYDQPLIPTELRIILSNHPSQVVKVEVLDAYGEHPDAVVYDGQAENIAECPFTLVIPIDHIDYLVMGVRITLQRAASPEDDSEIDAVMLLGRPQ